MKKTNILLLILILLILLGNHLFIWMTPIEASSISLKDNSQINGSSLSLSLSPESSIINEINSILGNHLYYKQRIINTYSQDDFRYEILIKQNGKEHEVTYQLLINLNEDDTTRLSSLSRVNITKISYEDTSIENYSIDLSTEQVNELMELIHNDVHDL